MGSTQVGSNSLNLEILNRNNYKPWRLRLKTYLLSEDLWDVVEAITEPPKLEDDQAGYKAWTKKNAKALYAIQNSCGAQMFPFISETESAKSAWNALEQECKDSQEYDEINDDHLERYISFIGYVWSGLWDKAKNCLGKIDVRSVVVRPLDKRTGDTRTALHLAALQGYTHIVKDLVQLMIMTPEDWKTKTDSGHTALHTAAWMGHVQVVKTLPVSLMGEVPDKDGDTALHIAVQEGKVDVVKELVLLMRQEDLKIKNDAGYTALHLAVNKGNMPMVKTIVTRAIGVNNIDDKDDFERYIPFTNYVTNGDWDKANECLRELEDDPCGAVTAVDPRDRYGHTALHVAAWKGYLNVIKGLVSLLKITRQEDHLELKTAEDFTTFGSGITVGVSEEFLMERAKYMVKQYEKTLGSCLEVQNARGFTALRLAVLLGNVEIVRELAPMMRQEGLEIKCLDGFTALHRAVAVKRLDIVQVLVPLMRKEGLEITDEDGDTPLNCAVSIGNVDIVKELTQSMRQEGLEIKDNHGWNALHRAIQEEHMHIVRVLMPSMRPEAFEEKDYYNSTALSWAIARLKDEDVYEVAKNMVARNDKVVAIPSGPHDFIPVVNALGGDKWELARYLYSLTPLELLNGPYGSSLICCFLIASKLIDLAWDLLQRYPNLAVTKTLNGENSPMLKLSRMSYTFLSGSQLTRWQRWIYNRIHIEVAQVNIHDISTTIAPSEADHQNERDLIPSDINLFRRLAEGLRKLCGINTLFEMKSTHRKVFEILRYMAEATKDHDLSEEQFETVKTSFFNAIQLGYFEFVTHICKKNPKLLGQLLEDKGVKGIFHFAIECRQKEVYGLIYELGEKERHDLGISLVNNDYNLLHYAANLSSRQQFDHIPDAGLQMQRELQWFKEVESVVPPEMYEHRNLSNDMTARELFTVNHKKLMEDAETSIKGTATSCTVVGALIVTMMFAAAFIIPGGNEGNMGRPLLKVYIVSDTISLASSTSSVITFLGILTSRYAANDFLKSLPTKIMIGLSTLFFSIVSMMVAFSCALIILFDGEAWIITVSVLCTSVPVILFMWLLFPLLIKTFMSTYGPGIFDKRKKDNKLVKS